MYNIIRIYNKQNNNSYIIIGMNTEFKVNENIQKLSNKTHYNCILQKEFNEYKKQLKRQYKKHELYKYINYDLLTFDNYYNYEVLEQIKELNFDIADNYILKYRELKKGYNQYTYKENKDYYNNFKEV